ncbi:MAG: NUDIX domain-containing protein [Nanoarchaeota archaeon]|nr:NUDIX domain-containing protein [Nanoarchaeota archaeon]
MKGLDKKERENIFKLFKKNAKLKFGEIEKSIKIRSNMVAYHLDCMVKEGLLEKTNNFYSLTDKAERYLPVLTHICDSELSPLPVVLVAVMDNDMNILLTKRERRPYKGYWGLIGGKMLLEENFEESTIRLVKDMTSLDSKFVSTNSVLHERVESNDIIKFSFILFFTKVKITSTDFKGSQPLKWYKLDELDKVKIIPSDLWLIKNKLNSKIDIKSAEMLDKEGELSGFKVLK